MRKFSKSAASWLAIISMASFLAGCDLLGMGGDPDPLPGASLTSITVAPTSAALTVGDTQSVTVTGLYDDDTTAPITDATWATSDAAVATVSAGTITAVAAGSASITATSGGKTASVAVTVTAVDVNKGIFSDAHPAETFDLQNAAGSGSVVPTSISDGSVTPFFGTNVISAAYAYGGGYGGFYFTVPTTGTVDVSGFANGKVVFTVNTSGLTGIAHMDIKVASGANPSEAGGIVDLGTLTATATSGSWSTYEVPLKAFSSYGTLPDFAALTTYLGFWNPTKSDASVASGTLLVDEVYFAPVNDLTSSSVTAGTPSPTIAKNASSTVVAYLNYTNGSRVKLDNTALTSWTSSNTAIATVTSAGVITAGTTAGSANITATYGGMTLTVAVTVPAGPTALAAAPSLAAGDVVNVYTASETYVNPGTVNFTPYWAGVNIVQDSTTVSGKTLQKVVFTATDQYTLSDVQLTIGTKKTLHISVFTPDGGTPLPVKIDLGGAHGLKVAATGTITQGQWSDLEYDFSTYDTTAIDVLLFDNPTTIGTYWVDNIYFH